HLPGRADALSGPARTWCDNSMRRRTRRGLPVHTGPDEQGDGWRADPADPALRRYAAGLEPDDVEFRNGEDTAPDHALHAAVLRHLHHQLPGRRDPLLDHDQLVDDPAAIHR